MPFHQPKPFERGEMTEGGRGPYPQRGRDSLQRGAAVRTLAEDDGSKGIDLATGEALECLHRETEGFGLYTLTPNY